MDYGFVPVTDDVTRKLNELIARRVPKTTLRNASTVREFVEDLNNDSGLHPAGDLLIGAHANSEGQWFIFLYPNQVDLYGRPTGHTEYENIEQTLEASAVGDTRRVRLDDNLIGWTGPPPTHNVHLKGCNLGKATPFLTTLKLALGDHVNVTAPKHFQGVVRRTSKDVNKRGSFEYMCYEFRVQTPAVPTDEGGFRGFATRTALLSAFAAAGHEYLGPPPLRPGVPVPAADWEKWVPKRDIETSQSFYMSLPLGRTVAGLKVITLRPNPEQGQKGAREFRVDPIPATWPFTPPTSATTYDARVAALKAVIEQDERFKSHHPWPVYERSGFATLDAFMAGHHWDFGEDNKGPVAIGRRFLYTVLLPITDNSGPNPKLIYNFYPAPGSAHSPIPPGIGENDLSFFARV